MGLYRYSNNSESFPMPQEHQKDDSFSKDCGHDKDDCDSKSERALKRILSLLDDLNNKDLRILEDIIERLLCSRPKDC